MLTYDWLVTEYADVWLASYRLCCIWLANYRLCWRMIG